MCHLLLVDPDLVPGIRDASRSLMATPDEPRPAISETEHVTTTVERDVIASPIGWSTIFAAAVIAAAVWFVLHMLGVGVGLVAIDTADPSSLRGVGIGTGVWSLIAPIIALFIGGLVAGRVAPTINTLNAVIHGAVVWALTVLASIIVMAMVVGALLRGVGKVGGTTADMAGASAETTGALVLTLSVMMILTLGSAILGSILSVRRERREHVVLPHAITN